MKESARGAPVRCPVCRTGVVQNVGCCIPRRSEEVKLWPLITWRAGIDQGISELMKPNSEQSGLASEPRVLIIGRWFALVSECVGVCFLGTSNLRWVRSVAKNGIGHTGCDLNQYITKSVPQYILPNEGRQLCRGMYLTSEQRNDPHFRHPINRLTVIRPTVRNRNG